MSIRTERVARLVQKEIASLLANEFSDQIEPMVTVTNARVTKDLGIAYINVSFMGASKAQREASLKHLVSLAPQIRHAFAARVRHQLRKVPELRFFLDETLEEARRIEDLFDRIRAEREHRNPTPDADE